MNPAGHGSASHHSSILLCPSTTAPEAPVAVGLPDFPLPTFEKCLPELIEHQQLADRNQMQPVQHLLPDMQRG